MKLSPRYAMPLLIVLLVVAVPLVVLALSIEDWSRDLTTNTAATSAAAADRRLHPIEKASSLEAIDAALERFVSQRRHWRIANEKSLPSDSPVTAEAGQPLAVRHFVRSTALLRFSDDVWLVIEDRGAGVVRLHADSRSRLGKADFGQNPRNLRELLGALSADL